MNPIEVRAYKCSECSKTYITKTIAETCCVKYACSECGAIARKGWVRCDACHAIARSKRERECFDRAEKVTEWDGPVFEPSGSGSKDGYYEDIDHLIEAYESNEDMLPEYVWTCDLESVSIDVDRVIENACEDKYEDARDHLVDVEGLRTAIEAWNEKQPKNCWETNYERALVLSKNVGE